MNLADKLEKEGLLEFLIGSLISADSNYDKETITANLEAIGKFRKELQESSLDEKRKSELIEVCDNGTVILEGDLNACSKESRDEEKGRVEHGVY